DLLRAGVLARNIDVLVKRHGCPFQSYGARPGAKPLEPFGKGSNALKAGTPDAGPESPTAQKLEQELEKAQAARAAVRSAPGRGRAEAGHIRDRDQRPKP